MFRDAIIDQKFPYWGEPKIDPFTGRLFSPFPWVSDKPFPGGLLTKLIRQAEILKFPRKHPLAAECTDCGVPFLMTMIQATITDERRGLCSSCCAEFTARVH